MHRGLSGLIGLWILFSLAVLAAIGWTVVRRDFQLYSGKTLLDQRITVFKRAGMNTSLPPVLDQAAQTWPVDAGYWIRGAGNSRSYVEYLLAPRLPTGGLHRIDVDGLTVDWEPQPTTTLRGMDAARSAPWFLLMAVMACLAAGSLADRLVAVTWPERLATGILLQGLLLISSKALTGHVLWGAIIFMGMAVLGLALSAVSRPDRHRCCGVNPSVTPRAHPSGNVWLMAGAALLGVLAVVLSFSLATVVVPDDWDAWAIWGAKAKVLLLGCGSPTDATFFGHGDYPLLWPALWSFTSWLSGGWDEYWSRGWGAVLMAAAAWEMGWMVCRASGAAPVWGWLTAAFFMVIPKVVIVSSWGYAEPLLWLNSTCALRWLLETRKGCRWKAAAVAGVFASAALWTKNDAALFVVTTAMVLMAGVPAGQRMRSGVSFMIPVTILYGPWLLYVREVLGLGSHATRGLGSDGGRLAYAVERMGPVMKAITAVWSDLQQWSLSLWILALLVSFGAVRSRFRDAGMLMIPFGMFTGFAILLMFHPDSVSWQVGSSWDRLTLQIVALGTPLAVMVALSGRQKRER